MSALILCLVFLLPAGSILRDIAREEIAARTERETARLTAALPPARMSLLPEDWPTALSPLSLPGIGATEDLAAVALSSRVPESRTGRHRAGEAPGTTDQQRRWTSPTGQFHALVDATWTTEERESLSQEWWCASCLDDHTDCLGMCACPCTLAGVS